MSQSSPLQYAPIIPLYWAYKKLDDIDNAALKQLVIANRDQKKPNSEPGDTNFEDIPLYPAALRSNALDALLAEVESAVQEVASIPLKLQGGFAWANIRSKGQSLAYHDHDDPRNPNANRLSFAYYVQANADNQPLVFPITLHAHRFNHAFKPETGQLQIFPSFLPHYTGQEDAPTEDRIVISGNYVEI